MLNPYFIAGLIEGEGYFGVNISKHDGMNVGYQVCLSFGIDMNCRELEMLQKVRDIFGCGSIHIGKSGKIQLRVRSFQDIKNKIIPFFDKYELQGGKKKDFEIFKIIALLMGDSKHLTSEGFDRIRDIRRNLHVYGTA